MNNKKIKVGITGGIGSGKTYVCKIFELMGYPVFYSDYEAKEIVRTNLEVRQKIRAIFGEESFLNEEYNRKYIASIVFQDKNKLIQLNQIIHPAVRNAFSEWSERQQSQLVFNEAALIFENQLEKNYDAVITVTADLDLRIERVMARDQISKEQVLSRMKNQLSDDLKCAKADFIIDNSQKEHLLPQIATFLNKISSF